MKLPAIIRGDTAAKLARAEEDLAACEQVIADAQQERLAKLLDAPADEIEAIDRKIVDQHRVAAVYRQRIEILQARLAQDQAEQKQRQREQAIAKAETILPVRMSAIEALAAWAKQGVGLVEKLELASQLKGWPPDLERPYYDDVRNDRVLRAIAAAFSGLGTDWHPARAVEIIADAVENEAAHHRQAIDDLKQNPAPEIERAA